ncbi:hypothetical protein FOL47_010395 [Perkinsus chesapeaki]|uniref:Uncharacterized protein n=1 Tax=Perkinsus chesapeaki TaxID=330153 RepID=A0A7J6MPP9_PERCH|nr:hypothetical protein FOL47_010395 [Perkinsus chesapeaki]
MLSQEANSTLIKSSILPSSSSYWKSNVKARRFTDEIGDCAMRPAKAFDNDSNMVQLKGLWISNGGPLLGEYRPISDESPIEECTCCCNKDGWLSFCADKTPSTVASSPPAKSRHSVGAFSLKAESNSDESKPPSRSFSPFSESKNLFPRDGVVADQELSLYGEPTEWQGILLETECVLKNFDGHSALRDKTYSSPDDLQEMAHLMGTEPSRPRYGRERSETIYDLEEYMDSLPDRSSSRGYRAAASATSSYRRLKGEKGRCDTEDCNCDSDEDILARMEAMGCDLDLTNE